MTPSVAVMASMSIIMIGLMHEFEECELCVDEWTDAEVYTGIHEMCLLCRNSVEYVAIHEEIPCFDCYNDLLNGVLDENSIQDGTCSICYESDAFSHQTNPLCFHHSATPKQSLNCLMKHAPIIGHPQSDIHHSTSEQLGVCCDGFAS